MFSRKATVCTSINALDWLAIDSTSPKTMTCSGGTATSTNIKASSCMHAFGSAGGSQLPGMRKYAPTRINMMTTCSFVQCLSRLFSSLDLIGIRDEYASSLVPGWYTYIYNRVRNDRLKKTNHSLPATAQLFKSPLHPLPCRPSQN